MSDQELVIRQMDKIGEQAKRIAKLEAQIAAVKECPVYFEGGVMEIAEDGLFPTDGMMAVSEVLAALKRRS